MKNSLTLEGIVIDDGFDIYIIPKNDEPVMLKAAIEKFVFGEEVLNWRAKTQVQYRITIEEIE